MIISVRKKIGRLHPLSCSSSGKQKPHKQKDKQTNHPDHNCVFKIVSQRELFFIYVPVLAFAQVKISGTRKTKQYGEQKG